MARISVLLAAVLLAILTPTSATGGERAISSEEVLSLARYFADQGRDDEGRAIVVELLGREPGNINAHQWYIHSWIRNHESLRVGEQYRAWLEEEPDDEIRRITRALSYSFSVQSTLSAEDCAAIEGLLSPLPKAPDRRAAALWRLHIAYRWESCEGNSDGVFEQLWLLEKTSRLASRLLIEQSRKLPLDARWLGVLQRSYRENPAHLRYADALWTDSRWNVDGEKLDGQPSDKDSSMMVEKELEKARSHALRAANRAANSKQLSVLSGAYKLLRAADQEARAKKLSDRLKALDERWQEKESSSAKGSPRELIRSIRAATRRYSPEQRLSSLDALEDDLGEDASARSSWLRARSNALLALGRSDEAIADLQTAHSLAPDNPALANEFAWQAALAGVQLEEALKASKLAIDKVRTEAWKPLSAGLWPGEFEKWSESQLRKEASYIDTKAWLLYSMERYQEAASTQREALRLLPEAELHLHMGLIYSKLDRPQDAVGHLSLGLLPDKGNDDSIEKQGRTALEQLFTSAGLWHPESAEGYLAVVERLRQRGLSVDEDDDDKQQEPSAKAEKFAAGTEFPDLSYKVGEVEHRLSDVAGLLLIDLWATWCGPCVKGMPHLDEVAREYKKHNVTSLALSVDAQQEEAIEFFAGESDLAFTQGWSGADTMQEVGIRGIPAVFILDKDLQVIGYVSGYRENDRRIEKILNQHLGIAD
jgi:thiol-disulfide isomerase/thioredoxin